MTYLALITSGCRESCYNAKLRGTEPNRPPQGLNPLVVGTAGRVFSCPYEHENPPNEFPQHSGE